MNRVERKRRRALHRMDHALVWYGRFVFFMLVVACLVVLVRTWT